jgi:hypothetical protein
LLDQRGPVVWTAVGPETDVHHARLRAGPLENELHRFEQLHRVAEILADDILRVPGDVGPGQLNKHDVCFGSDTARTRAVSIPGGDIADMGTVRTLRIDRRTITQPRVRIVRLQRGVDVGRFV